VCSSDLVLSIAEGALIEVGNMLQRMRELAIQSSNGIYTDSQRNYIQIEIDELSNEIDRIAGCTQYNKMSLLNGDTGTSSNYNPWNSSNGAFLHIGANNVEMNDVLNVKLYAANCDALGIRDKNAIPPLPTQLVDLSNQTSAFSAISTLDDAITKVTTLRANIGAYINRLDGALTNQQNVLENVISAESLIRDTDYAEEMTNFTRLNLLQQSSVSMLAQANSLPNNILNLLKF
jgi:flagellin